MYSIVRDAAGRCSLTHARAPHGTSPLLHSAAGPGLVGCQLHNKVPNGCADRGLQLRLCRVLVCGAILGDFVDRLGLGSPPPPWCSAGGRRMQNRLHRARLPAAHLLWMATASWAPCCCGPPQLESLRRQSEAPVSRAMRWRAPAPCGCRSRPQRWPSEAPPAAREEGRR
jgi:hypothetical protein